MGATYSGNLQLHTTAFCAMKLMFARQLLSCLLLFTVIGTGWPSKSAAEPFSLAQRPDPIDRIAIDPGFGGKDFGAPSCKEGLYAKHINLEIAKRLASMIREELHVEVIMTRTSDRFETLERRTAIANMKNADLFISIHCNAHEDQRIYGIETYFLNMALDAPAMLVAAERNATSIKNSRDLNEILDDLTLTTKIADSRLFADCIQASLYKHMKDRYDVIKNRGIKQAPFYVLIGTEMPSILIEVSFLSNPRECKRLISEDYQDDLCQGIVRNKGVHQQY